MQRVSAQRGFGSGESLIILLLIGVLIGILVYSSGFFQKRNRDGERQQMMKEITIGLEDYKEKNEHYPVAGDSIPGGAVVAGNNNFNSVMTLLDQGNFLEAKKIVDPLFGKLFGEFNGVDKLYDGTKFISKIDLCEGETVIAQVDTTGIVSYSYFSLDGESYTMCLLNENGEVTTYISPKD